MVVSNIFHFHPYLGKIPILTNIFQRGWFNHQLVNGWSKSPFPSIQNCLALGYYQVVSCPLWNRHPSGVESTNSAWRSIPASKFFIRAKTTPQFLGCGKNRPQSIAARFGSVLAGCFFSKNTFNAGNLMFSGGLFHPFFGTKNLREAALLDLATWHVWNLVNSRIFTISTSWGW